MYEARERQAFQWVESPPARLYLVAKDFFLTVESSGVASVRLLQAGVFWRWMRQVISIYPQAYMSIGHLGRFG